MLAAVAPNQFVGDVDGSSGKMPYVGFNVVLLVRVW
jgi:hypothetical protein